MDKKTKAAIAASIKHIEKKKLKDPRRNNKWGKSGRKIIMRNNKLVQNKE